MTIKTLIDCERKSLEKLKNFQIPNRFKIVGLWLFIVSFVFLFINKFAMDDLIIRDIVRYGMLIGLLLVSISREKIEDELSINLKMQSYMFAFIVGVIFSLLMPFVDYIFDYIFKTNGAILKDLGDWEIIFILLSAQVVYFEFLKKQHK